MGTSIEFTTALAKRYQIGSEYVAAYLDYWHTNKALTPCRSVVDIDRMQSHEKMWFEFALSANSRGRVFADYICKTLQTSAPNSFLDIGCGFGGILAAFCERGTQVTGIEIDPVRIELAGANLKAYASESQVTNSNILDHHWVANSEKFEVITCIDVIEHVADVAQTLKNIEALLLPGGTAFLEIPNKDCLSFVLADGHFSLFGITQLPRWAAIRYHANHFQFEYDVGDYYDSSYYTRVANSLNLSGQIELSPLHEFCSAGRATSLELSIDSALADFNSRRLCDAEVDPLIHAVVERFMKRYRTSKHQANETHELQYLAPFWMLRITKK